MSQIVPNYSSPWLDRLNMFNIRKTVNVIANYNKKCISHVSTIIQRHWKRLFKKQGLIWQRHKDCSSLQHGTETRLFILKTGLYLIHCEIKFVPVISEWSEFDSAVLLIVRELCHVHCTTCSDTCFRWVIHVAIAEHKG